MQNNIQGMIQFLKNIHYMKKYDNVTLSHCWYILSQSFENNLTILPKAVKLFIQFDSKISLADNFPMKISQNVEKLTLQIYNQVAKYSEPTRF